MNHIKNKQMMIIIKVLMIFIVLPSATAATQLLRFADIHKDQVVFVYGGDIYTSSIINGEAKRLTADTGFETFPKGLLSLLNTLAQDRSM